MSPQTVIFIGPPGSGKGTQATKLAAAFREQVSADQEVLSVDVGAAFRELQELSNATSQRITTDMGHGDLLPTFLSAHLWTDVLVNQLSENTHLLLDGSPRRLMEAKLFDQAVNFYQRETPIVLHLQIDRSTSVERLADRDRADDPPAVVKHRLQQYEKETVPVTEYYQRSDAYRYLQIDGERSVEAIHKDIRAAVIPDQV